MGANTPDIDLARHLLAALVYRTRAAVDETSDDFATYTPGEKVRTPAEIVSHMTSVIAYINVVIENAERDMTKAGSWKATKGQFYRAVSEAAAALSRWDSPDADVLRRLVQGPIADAMTHAGQLAMLRRMAGEPVPPQNFYAADISEAMLQPGANE